MPLRVDIEDLLDRNNLEEEQAGHSVRSALDQCDLGGLD